MLEFDATPKTRLRSLLRSAVKELRRLRRDGIQVTVHVHLPPVVGNSLPQTSALKPPPKPSTTSDVCSDDRSGRRISQCVLDILATLEEVGRPLTATRLLSEMAKREREWSDRAVGGHLARMVEEGTLLNGGLGMKNAGYRLPEWSENREPTEAEAEAQ
jgi:hypothetical protein